MRRTCCSVASRGRRWRRLLVRWKARCKEKRKTKNENVTHAKTSASNDRRPGGVYVAGARGAAAARRRGEERRSRRHLAVRQKSQDGESEFRSERFVR